MYHFGLVHKVDLTQDFVVFESLQCGDHICPPTLYVGSLNLHQIVFNNMAYVLMYGICGYAEIYLR